MRGIHFLVEGSLYAYEEKRRFVGAVEMKPVSKVLFSLLEGEVAGMREVPIPSLLPSVAVALPNRNICLLTKLSSYCFLTVGFLATPDSCLSFKI